MRKKFFVLEYDEMIKLNKPFGIAELGPRNPNGSFDYMVYGIYLFNK
jgi:beta-mannanase